MTNRVEIVEDPSDVECADAVVCRRLTKPLLQPDNLIDLCSKCGEAIQFRPNAPNRPPKICDQCARPILEAEAAKGELVVMVTEKTADDLADYLEKKNAN